MKLPPGFRKVNGQARANYSAETGDKVIYSVLKWYGQEYGDQMSAEVKEAYQEQLKATGERLFRAWLKEVLANCSPLVRLNNSSIELVPGYFMQTADVEAGLSKLALLREQLESPLVFDIPLEGCLHADFWKGTNGAYKEQFSLWAHATKRIEVPDMDGFDRNGFLARLAELRVVVEKRRKVLAFLEAFTQDNLLSDADWKRMLQEATLLKKSLPDGLTFEPIGDFTTLAEFEKKTASIPEQYLSIALKGIGTRLEQEETRLTKIGLSSDAGTQKLVEKCESEISALLQDLSGDERFEAALPKSQSKFEELVVSCAKLRGQVWHDLMEAQVKQGFFWESSLLFKGFWDELVAKADHEMRLYFTISTIGEVHKSFAEILRERLLEHYFSILPQAHAEYGKRAENAANVQGKYGVCLALTTMLREMFQLPKGISLPDGLAALQASSMEQEQKAESIIREKSLRRSIFLSDMTSATPGIGLTYTRDLENELKAVLASFGMGQLVIFPDKSSAAANWDYFTSNGRVANFDGQDMTERQTTRMLRMFGEARRVENPSYVKDAGRDAPQSQTAIMKYMQEESLRIIHVKEMERQAHLRLFMTMRGPGFSQRIEINEFYKKIFYIEESHPFSDSKVVNLHEYYDAMKVPPVTPEPELRYDRVWTPGEILDWARRDSLKVVALKLFYYIDSYPLFLQDKATRLRANGEVSNALDCLGHLHLLCQSLDVDSDISKFITANEAPVATSYVKTLEQLRSQRRKLSAIKQKSLSVMLEVADAFLRQN